MTGTDVSWPPSKRRGPSPPLFAVEYSMAKTLAELGSSAPGAHWPQHRRICGRLPGRRVPTSGCAPPRGAAKPVDAIDGPRHHGCCFRLRGAARSRSRGPDSRLPPANGPQLCVVSGESEELKLWEKRLVGAGREMKLLHTSHAFHSWMMDPALHLFRREFETVRLAAPAIPFVSNLTRE